MSLFRGISSALGAVGKVASMLYSYFKWKTSRCRRLQRKIELKERQLAQALREGRVTDAGKLAEERRRLYESYRGCPDEISIDDEE